MTGFKQPHANHSTRYHTPSVRIACVRVSVSVKVQHGQPPALDTCPGLSSPCHPAEPLPERCLLRPPAFLQIQLWKHTVLPGSTEPPVPPPAFATASLKSASDSPGH